MLAVHPRRDPITLNKSTNNNENTIETISIILILDKPTSKQALKESVKLAKSSKINFVGITDG